MSSDAADELMLMNGGVFGMPDTIAEIVLQGAGIYHVQLMATEIVMTAEAWTDSKPPTRSAAMDLDVPAGAIVERATVTIRVRPSRNPKISEVAETRDDPNGVVIDFGRMRSVRGVEVTGATIADVQPWLGTQFQSFFESEAEGDGRTFSEVQTERLLIDVDAKAAEVATKGRVDLVSAPADLELLVGGRRAWFQPNEVKRGAIGTTLGDKDYFVAVVDVTDAVATAARAAVKVPIELRAATAGVLAIEPSLRIQRVHAVGFPEGPERPVSFAIEGTGTLTLPLTPPEAWSVYGVSMTVASRLGPSRGLFPATVAHSADAELLLDLDHAIAIKIGADQTAPFGKLTGARVELYVEPGGAEIAGVLLRDDGGKPGEPLPGGELAPVVLAEAPRKAGTPVWAAVLAARPVAAPGGPIWVSLQVSRGTVVVPLAQSGGGSVRRAIPGGQWREFSKAIGIVPAASVRLLGEAPEGAPIHALAASIGGGAVQMVTPTQEGVIVTVKPPPRSDGTPGALTTSGSITVALTTTAATTYRFSNVQVFYRLVSEEPAR